MQVGQQVVHKDSGRRGVVKGYVASDWYQIETAPGVLETWHLDRFDYAPDESRNDGAVRLVFCLKCHCHYTSRCEKGHEVEIVRTA